MPKAKTDKPKIVERLIGQLRSNGVAPGAAQAIAISKMREAGNIKKGSMAPTKKGEDRGNMTPAERAKDRAAKSTGGKASDFKYNKKNNSAVKGSINKDVKKRS